MEGKEKKTDPRAKSSHLSFFNFPADKPSDENMCQCENVILFQNQVTEKLRSLAQNNILV